MINDYDKELRRKFEGAQRKHSHRDTRMNMVWMVRNGRMQKCTGPVPRRTLAGRHRSEHG